MYDAWYVCLEEINLDTLQMNTECFTAFYVQLR